MRATTREVGKLKLVHPGRHVEIHTKPIPAAEIMRRNPRHCITRPDVFENPWLVVKPEAILHPGKVFLIVPNHKIYSLLKANGHHIQSSPPLQNQSPKNHGHSLLHKHTSTQQSQSPQNHVHHQLHTKILPSPWEQNCHENLINKEMVAMYMDSYPKFKEESSVDLMMRSSCPNEYYYRGNNNSEAAPKNDNGNFNYCEQGTKLRSCLRQQETTRKSLPLRVDFSLPNEYDKAAKESPGVSNRIFRLPCWAVPAHSYDI